METTLKIHPAAELFPMMSEDQFQKLKEDIRINGQREYVTVWKGLLIDGRNRLKACEELGIEPLISELMEESDPVEYVLGHNLHRRHLTTNQRAVVAAKLATLRHGEYLRKMPENSKGVHSMHTLGGQREMLTVTESGIEPNSEMSPNSVKLKLQLPKTQQSGVCSKMADLPNLNKLYKATAEDFWRNGFRKPIR